MNIGFIVNNICQHGGVERTVSAVSNLLQERGHHITIFSCFSTSKKDEYYPLHKSIKVIHIADIFCNSFMYKHFSNHKLWIYFKILMFIKKHLKTNYFDFLISACYWSNQLLPFFVRKGKIIACDHGDFNSLTLLDRTMARCCYRFSDAVVLLHEKHAENYTFIPDNKKFVIPNPIPFQTEKKADCVNKKMLFLARLSCEKGADLLLDIAEKLKEKIPEWQIDIYGDGPEEYKLKQLAESKNLSGFLFFHPATNNVLEKYLESSIYLMTSRHEGLPMVLLEAQTCGLPTVAYDCNIGPRCVITHGENGYLIPPGEKELFAEHVVKLASDLKHRQQLGKNAIKNSEKFLPEVIVAKWINLFQELLSRQEKK